MEIYDSRYFVHAKRFQELLGIWPYQSRLKNNCSWVILSFLFIAMIIPQIVGLSVHAGKDSKRTLECTFGTCYMLAIYMKLLVACADKDKAKFIFEYTARNFKKINDNDERKILIEYSERGRLIGVVYTIFVLAALGVFVVVPLAPGILDVILPLENGTRSKFFILNGEFLVDKTEYFIEIYAFDSICCIVTVLIICATDPLYAAILEHCLAIFAIVKLRLRKYRVRKGLKCVSADEAEYEAIIRAVQLHREIIAFIETIQNNCSLYFAFEMGVTLISFTVNFVLAVLKTPDLFDRLRLAMVLFAQAVHLFYITWPGQKLIDHGEDLFKETYFNDWYKSSVKCQKALRFMSLRCSKPCKLSGAGVYVLNFAYTLLILKTSASYITVVAQFEYKIVA
ncbi:odorant receptor 129 [Nasonia vitripennis]|uniref:Odorant receptor n=1 Tax=Nasonia vitripennis TaxID=7425 RepID=A0A7M6USG1_NASVI|nr:odorant receptor 129 [Nasonia vitripennis]